MSNGSTSTAPITSPQTIGIPRPSTPGALTNQNLQNVSFYKTLRSVVSVAAGIVAAGSQSLGTVATYASDGSPLTFTQGNLNAVLVRVFANGSTIAPSGAPTWVAGGGETQVSHSLGRIAIGYWVVRNKLGAMISDGDSTWTTTSIYLHTTHSDSDIILMIF